MNEFRRELEDAGLKVVEIVGVEGLASHHPKEYNRLYRRHKDAWRNWWEIHLKLCTDEVISDISEHILAICRNKE